MNAVGPRRIICELINGNPPEPPTVFDKVRQVAGILIAVIGTLIFLGATMALAGTLTGHVILSVESIHTLFMTGVVSAVAGFHLLKGAASVEISAGPVAVTV